MNDNTEKIKTWLRSELEGARKGAKKRLAAKLNVSPSVITRMVNEDPLKLDRRIYADELPIMEEFFGSSPFESSPLYRNTELRYFETQTKELSLDLFRDQICIEISGQVDMRRLTNSEWSVFADRYHTLINQYRKYRDKDQ